MKVFILFLLSALLMGCKPRTNTLVAREKDSLISGVKHNEIEPLVKYKTIMQVTDDTGISIWRAGPLDASSRFHFNQLRDTLLIEYYPECWGDYPIKINGNKIIAYWNDNLDTKYGFDVVKIIERNRGLKGKPFLSFVLSSDTTLDVTYLNEELVNSINRVNKERTFLPKQLQIEPSEYYTSSDSLLP